EPGDGAAGVEAKTAGEVAGGEGEAAAERYVQDPAQEKAGPWHLGSASSDIAGSDDHLRALARRPDVAQERRVVGPVRIQGQHVITSSRAKAGPQRSAVAGSLLEDGPGPVTPGDLDGRVLGTAVDHDHLRGQVERP